MELVLTMIYWEVRKSINTKVLHFILQLRDFGTHLIVQICYNLLSYRDEGFTGKYDTKIQTACYVHRLRKTSNTCAVLLSSFAFFLADFKKNRECSQSIEVGWFPNRNFWWYWSHYLFSRLFTVACANSQFVYNN